MLSSRLMAPLARFGFRISQGRKNVFLRNSSARGNEVFVTRKTFPRKPGKVSAKQLNWVQGLSYVPYHTALYQVWEVSHMERFFHQCSYVSSKSFLLSLLLRADHDLGNEMIAEVKQHGRVVVEGYMAVQIRDLLLGKRLLYTSLVDNQKRKIEDYDSESDDDDSDDEYGHSKERGDSPFWQRKMRTLHRLLDVNKDGVVSFDDFTLLADKFTSLGHLSEKHHEEFVAKIKEAWELQRGAVHPYNLVTTEQFLEDMHHILNDRRLRKKVHQFLPYFFKAVDKDKDGQISVEEFKLFFQCLGLTDADAVMSFRTIDMDMDGRLSLKEFVKLGREYLLSENENSASKYFWGPLCDV